MWFLPYALTFLAGGYLIPFTNYFFGIWRYERLAPDNPSTFDVFMTAFLGALLWPLHDECYIAQSDEDE